MSGLTLVRPVNRSDNSVSHVITFSQIGEQIGYFADALRVSGLSVCGYFDISSHVPGIDERSISYRLGMADQIEHAGIVFMTPSARASLLGEYVAGVCRVDSVPIGIIPEETIE